MPDVERMLTICCRSACFPEQTTTAQYLGQEEKKGARNVPPMWTYVGCTAVVRIKYEIETNGDEQERERIVRAISFEGYPNHSETCRNTQRPNRAPDWPLHPDIKVPVFFFTLSLPPHRGRRTCVHNQYPSPCSPSPLSSLLPSPLSFFSLLSLISSLIPLQSSPLVFLDF